MKREELLCCVSEGQVDKFITLCNCGSSELKDVISSCSKNQLDQLWDGCKQMCMESLLGLEGADVAMETEGETELSQMLDVLQCLVSMAMATVSQEQIYVSPSLLESAVILHGMLLSLPETADKLKNNIAKLFEYWWSKNVDGREELGINTLLYLVDRSQQFSALLVEVKRVWGIHDILSLVNFSNQSSARLRSILAQCFMQHNYLKTNEGCRFLSFILSLNTDFIEEVHNLVKNQLPSSPKSRIQKYGEVYFRAWQKADTAEAEKLEIHCIQDFMYHAIHASRPLFSVLRRLLGYIHLQKKQKGVNEMLYRLYEPILWRSLKVANGNVRWNAVSLLIDVFPLQRPEDNAEETDHVIQKQFEVFMSLLEDPCPSVRSITILGVCKIMASFWEMIPSETLRSFISKLIKDLVWDMSSTEVRESVFKGLAVLMENHLCHLLFKPILPELKNFIHDISEKVRTAVVDLLLRVEGLQAIKFWNIVPVDHLLARLESDTTPIVRRIMKLLFTSFVPLGQPGNVLVQRCIILIQSNSVAARKFYQNAPQYMSIHEVARYMTLLCKYILECMRSKQDENGNPEEDSEEENDQNNTSEVTNKSTLPDNSVLLGIIEAIVILWTGIVEKLEKSENSEIKESLNKKFGLAVPEMLKTFEDPQICAALILLGSYLPSSCVQYLSRSCLSKLRNMTSDNEQDYTPLLEACCKWGKSSEILELIGDWIKPVFSPKNTNRTNRCIKKKKSVGFVDPVEPQPKLALEYLSYLTSHLVFQNILLTKNRAGLLEVKTILKSVLSCIENKMRENGSETVDNSLLVSALVLYCNLSIILHTADNTDDSAVPTFEDLLAWADLELIPMFGGNVGNDTEIENKKKKRMLCSMNVTLVPSPGDDLEDSEREGNKKKKLLNRTNITLLATPSENVKEESTSQKTRKRSIGFTEISKDSKDSKELTYNSVKIVLEACRDMLLIGVGNVDLSIHIAEFCTRCLQADRDLNLLSQVLSCLHQVTEYVFIQQDDNGNGLKGSAIPGFLTSLMTTLASHIRFQRDAAPQILVSVRGHMLEIMMTIFRTQITEETYLQDVMATLVTSIVAELANHSQKMYLIQTPDNLTELPVLTSWLVDILCRKAYLSRYFIKEMSSCFESGAVTEIHKVHGGVHLLSTLCKCKPRLSGLKECWEILHTQADKLDDNLEKTVTFEDTKTVCIANSQEVRNLIADKLKECEESLQRRKTVI